TTLPRTLHLSRRESNHQQILVDIVAKVDTHGPEILTRVHRRHGNEALSKRVDSPARSRHLSSGVHRRVVYPVGRARRSDSEGLASEQYESDRLQWSRRPRRRLQDGDSASGGPLVPLHGSRVASGLVDSRRDRSDEPDVRKVRRRAGYHQHDPDGVPRQHHGDGAAEKATELGRRSEPAQRRRRAHLGYQRSGKLEATLALEDGKHWCPPHWIPGRQVCESQGGDSRLFRTYT